MTPLEFLIWAGAVLLALLGLGLVILTIWAIVAGLREEQDK